MANRLRSPFKLAILKILVRPQIFRIEIREFREMDRNLGYRVPIEIKIAELRNVIRALRPLFPAVFEPSSAVEATDASTCAKWLHCRAARIPIC